MSESIFKTIIIVAAVFFTGFFVVVVVPPLIANPDIVGAFASGFVNPYASGYSTDVLVCWVILAAWIIFEARVFSVKKGWVCLLLGVVPGVAVGFASYLLIRMRQTKTVRK
ncbi:MAG: DUF2834 domain-containing protein [Pseudomonadota bacterium]